MLSRYDARHDSGYERHSANGGANADSSFGSGRNAWRRRCCGSVAARCSLNRLSTLGLQHFWLGSCRQLTLTGGAITAPVVDKVLVEEVEEVDEDDVTVPVAAVGLVVVGRALPTVLEGVEFDVTMVDESDVTDAVVDAALGVGVVVANGADEAMEVVAGEVVAAGVLASSTAAKGLAFCDL